MKHKRIYVHVPLRRYFRIPLSGKAILSNSSTPTIRARTIDISQGGVAVKTFSEEVPTAKYQIEILTEAGQRIEFIAQLVRADDSIAGFQTLQLDQESQGVIRNLFIEYQKTNDFITQLDEFNLFDHKVVDEEEIDM